VADSISFRVADINERGAKMQIASPRIDECAGKIDAILNAIVHLADALINSG
jgi:hypothetical protein